MTYLKHVGVEDHRINYTFLEAWPMLWRLVHGFHLSQAKPILTPSPRGVKANVTMQSK